MFRVIYESEKEIPKGVCCDCPYHFANMKPAEGEAATGCGLNGKLLPDDWNYEEEPYPHCPVIRCVPENLEGEE